MNAELTKEIMEVIKKNRTKLEDIQTEDRAAWVLLSIANSPTFRRGVPSEHSEEFLTEKDLVLGYIYKVSTLIKKLLSEEKL
jgi:hypothetical protein